MKLLNVQNLIETQSQKHKDRLLGQYSRLLDSAPSFPLYYSIDGVNSTAELGTRDVMSYVGPDSPVKFKKVLNMPMYALNIITAEITVDEITGAYTDFEDTALVLNSVLRPLPGDHFILPEFNREVMFKVTGVHIRAIRGEDHYTIDYSVVPSSRMLNIERQVVETYETMFRNIGTEDKVLIKQSEYNLLNEYLDAYTQIQERYIDENYSKDFGYLTTPEYLTDGIGFGTCKYLIKFLMMNRIIYFDEMLNTIFAFEMVLPFEAKHNKLYAQSFLLNAFMKKNVPIGALYVNFKPLPVALFKEVNNTKLGQSVEFNAIPLASVAGYIPTPTEVLVYDETFPTKIAAKNYSDLTPIQNVLSKFINGEDIETEEFIECVEDYAVSDIFRFYFLPMVMMILKVNIKALQIATK